MLRKRLLLISILLLFILNMGLVFASDNMTNITDGTETDSIENDNIILPSGNNWSDVQESIDMANENDTIELEGTYSGDGNVINVNKSLTFQGKANATFDAQGKSKIFNINSSNVLFKNITFINGYDEIAGAIYSKDSTISFIDCTFRDNTALNNGGAIKSNYGTLTVINSTFINNSAINGGAINHYGFELGFVSIIGSTFINNTAKWGGAIWVDGDLYTSLSIINSTFINNSAEDDGAITNRESDLIITSSTFINNTARRTGGAVRFSPSWFEKNCSIVNSTFIGNSATSGGALIINNIKSYDVDYYPMSDKNVTLKNNVFKNNYANKGGAIYALSNINMDDSIFENNTAESIGSLILISGVSNISRCTFLNDTKGNIYLTTRETNNRYYNPELPGKLTIEDSVYENCILLDNDLNPTSAVNVNVTGTTFIYDGCEELTIQLSDMIFQSPLSGNLTVKIGSKTYDVHANSTGIATFKIPDLNVGKHSLVVMHKKSSDLFINDTYLNIIIKKAKTTVKAPKVTNKFKKSKYFKVTVTHKTTKKPVKSTWINLKIDKKTYKVKTNSKGIAKFNTKTLKLGKHKVKITSANKNYKMSAKSTIIIKR